MGSFILTPPQNEEHEHSSADSRYANLKLANSTFQGLLASGEMFGSHWPARKFRMAAASDKRGERDEPGRRPVGEHVRVEQSTCEFKLQIINSKPR